MMRLYELKILLIKKINEIIILTLSDDLIEKKSKM